MAAGLGFIEFTTGDVLTAAAANGYLASQVVMVFADSAARTTAITSPQEGMISFLKDTNSTEYYSGSAWVAIGGGSSPLTTKGDLYTFDTADARLGVGANGTVLTADSAEATGLKWVAPTGSSGPAFRANRTGGTQSISNGVTTKIELNAESFDTDSCYDPTTNFRFTPNKAGYYQINCTYSLGSSTSISRFVGELFLNGAQFLRPFDAENRSTFNGSGSNLVYLNGTTDYLEMYVYATGSGIVLSDGLAGLSFSGVWIRS